MPRINEIDP